MEDEDIYLMAKKSNVHFEVSNIDTWLYHLLSLLHNTMTHLYMGVKAVSLVCAIHVGLSSIQYSYWLPENGCTPCPAKVNMVVTSCSVCMSRITRFNSDGVNFSINSDDPCVMRTTLIDDYVMASNEFGLDYKQIKQSVSCFSLLITMTIITGIKWCRRHFLI